MLELGHLKLFSELMLDSYSLIVIRLLEFQTRCQNERIKSEVGKQELIVGSESPSMDSLGTSVEVQTGNSVEVHSIQEENLAAQHRLTQQKARAQVLRLKVEHKQL